MRSHIATLCPTCGPDCCPVVTKDDSLPAEKQIEIIDDFGGKVNMSRDQFADLVLKAKEGKLTV